MDTGVGQLCAPSPPYGFPCSQGAPLRPVSCHGSHGRSMPMTLAGMGGARRGLYHFFP